MSLDSFVYGVCVIVVLHALAHKKGETIKATRFNILIAGVPLLIMLALVAIQLPEYLGFWAAACLGIFTGQLLVMRLTS